MRKEADQYSVLPVAKAMQVFTYVASQAHDVTLTEVVQALDSPKTTVFRYLQTLSSAGLFSHDVERDRYGVGNGFRRLAQIDAAYHNLRSNAQVELDGIVAGFRETIWRCCRRAMSSMSIFGKPIAPNGSRRVSVTAIRSIPPRWARP